MRTIIMAVVAAVALGGLAAFLLAENQRLAYQAFATSGARVTPTDNLVGPKWNGDPDPKAMKSPG